MNLMTSADIDMMWKFRERLLDVSDESLGTGLDILTHELAACENKQSNLANQIGLRIQVIEKIIEERVKAAHTDVMNGRPL